MEDISFKNFWFNMQAILKVVVELSIYSTWKAVYLGIKL